MGCLFPISVERMLANYAREVFVLFRPGTVDPRVCFLPKQKGHHQRIEEHGDCLCIESDQTAIRL